MSTADRFLQQAAGLVTLALITLQYDGSASHQCSTSEGAITFEWQRLTFKPQQFSHFFSGGGVLKGSEVKVNARLTPMAFLRFSNSHVIQSGQDLPSASVQNLVNLLGDFLPVLNCCLLYKKNLHAFQAGNSRTLVC